MSTIELRTELDCSCERAFALSLDLDLQLRATARFGLRIVGQRRGGRIGPGETVTWRLRQFGIPLKHTSVISEYDPPLRFVDEMAHGVLAEFRHEHRFLSRSDGGCTMLDTISYRLPARWLGALADQLVIRRRLLELLRDRNTEVRRTVTHRVGFRQVSVARRVRRRQVRWYA